MKFQDQMEFLAFRALIGGLRSLPYNKAQSLLIHLGQLTGKTLRIRRSTVEIQLKTIFPNEASQRLDSLADLVYHNLALTVAETFCADSAQLVKAVRVTPGWEEMDQALSKGRGAIVATGHLGNFELGGAVLARRYSLLDVVKSQRNVPFDRYLETMRSDRGIQTVPMQNSAPRILRHLRSGGLVSLLLDQDAGDRGMAIPFLGQPASTWPGVARFSIRTGCPVIPMALIRDPNSGQTISHELKISSPLWPDGYSDRPEEVQKYLQNISAAVEAFILENPEQWFWVHRRWKNGKGEVEYGAGAKR